MKTLLSALLLCLLGTAVAETPGITEKTYDWVQSEYTLAEYQIPDNNPTWFINYEGDGVLKVRFAHSLGSGFYVYPAAGVDVAQNNYEYFTGDFSIAYMPTIFPGGYLGVEFGVGYVTETDLDDLAADPLKYIGGVAYVRGGYAFSLAGYYMGLFGEIGNVSNSINDWSLESLEFGGGLTINLK